LSLDPAAGPPVIARAFGHDARTAVVAVDGRASYADLLTRSHRVAACLLDGSPDLAGARVAYLVAPGCAWVATLWGIWRAGGVAVPLAESHPPAELDYVLADSGAAIVVADATHAGRVRPLAAARGIRLVLVEAALLCQPGPLPTVPGGRRALIFYTSGTTARPKGAVLTHDNIAAQAASLVEAWGWTPEDVILGVLPLHHVHGVVNVLACALWSGAVCELAPGFEAERTWDRLMAGGLTLFMAVPTVYARLIAAWEAAPRERRVRMTAACEGLRLMVSGSAALPVRVLEQWRTISGHTLLERYGMTEIGMALSNPLHGKRRPGHVGRPLPGVEVRLVDETGMLVPPGTPGEIEVRGPTVFLEYLNQPDATREAFRDGWFRTGDIAVLEEGSYRILGRNSVDIIKTGGYKISALEIEEVLREHPAVRECAVVGLEDPEWGERVCAAVVLRDGAALSLDALRDWARERLAPYKLPGRLVALAALPRNAMGKVVKPEVRRAAASESEK
jgi:malonyl-CoA/methylmalonyl-CoA synthetase